jgi:hypothetical protein
MLAESGFLEFEEFVTLASKFAEEQDEAVMEKELREAFRLYDKEGEFPILPQYCTNNIFVFFSHIFVTF